MKSIIIFMFSFAVAISQDFDPQQVPFNYKGNSQYYISSDSADFHDNSFQLGWHWSYGRKMTNSLNMTQAMIYGEIPADKLADSINLILQPRGIKTNKCGTNVLDALSIQYEPTLKIESSYNFANITNDETDEVFGFQKVMGHIENDHLYLFTDSLNNEIVLDSNILAERFYNTGNEGVQDYVKYNSELMHLSFNVNRINLHDTIMDNQPVLALKIHYVAEQGVNKRRDYIKFSKVPVYNTDYIISLSNNRGIVLLESSTDTINEIIITRNMLPQDGSNITISSLFK